MGKRGAQSKLDQDTNLDALEGDDGGFSASSFNTRTKKASADILANRKRFRRSDKKAAKKSAPNPFASIEFEAEAAPAPQVMPQMDGGKKETVFEKLNKSFFKYVQRHIVENPTSNWSIAMTEYIQHAKKLESDCESTDFTSSTQPALNLTPPSKSSNIPPDLEEHVYKKLDGFQPMYITLAKMYKFVNWVEGADPKWVSFGRGYLQVFTPDDSSGKVRVLLIRDDATKKINLNTNIETSGPVKTTCERQGKKDVLMKAVVINTKDDDEGNMQRGLGQVMFRVKDSTAADLLFSAINQHVKA